MSFCQLSTSFYLQDTCQKRNGNDYLQSAPNRKHVYFQMLLKILLLSFLKLEQLYESLSLFGVR